MKPTYEDVFMLAGACAYFEGELMPKITQIINNTTGDIQTKAEDYRNNICGMYETLTESDPFESEDALNKTKSFILEVKRLDQFVTFLDNEICNCDGSCGDACKCGGCDD